MIWQDLLLDAWIGESSLRDAAAGAFGVPESAVTVIDDVEQLAAVSPQTRIILERVRQQRDFPLQLTVILRDDDLATRHAGFEGALRVARQLAEALGAVVLFAEGPLGPSEWVRVQPSGHLDLVSLDTDDSSDIDSFFVVAERSYVPSQVEAARRTA